MEVYLQMVSKFTGFAKGEAKQTSLKTVDKISNLRHDGARIN